MMTEDERAFLLQKRDGLIPVTTGWAEWKLTRRVRAMRGIAVGRVAHYVAYGSPGGEFPAGVCRAAIIADVGLHIENQTIDGEGTPTTVSLTVFNPSGLYFNPSVPYDEGRLLPPKGTPPDAPQVRIYRPGTWHWPEQV